LIGEVVVPLAVTLRTLAIVRTPPRWLSGGRATFRNSQPSIPDPAVARQPSVEDREVRGDEVARLRSPEDL
jgi:hypothetical protein